MAYTKHYMLLIRQEMRMPRFRSRNSLRPIHRIKHVVDQQGALAVNTRSDTDVIRASDTPDLANTVEVETGSSVNAIYLKVEVYATSSAALSNAYLMVWKNPGGNITGFNPNTVGSNDNKRFVIHQEMVMMQQATNGNPRTLFNGVIMIPKGYRRFAPNDELTIALLTPGVTANFCFQVHYKEFR